jgi:hypothetical protein
MAEILLLFTEKPMANATAYLIGFLAGVGVVLGVLVAIAGSVNLSAGSGTTKGAGTLQLVLGLALLFGAVRRFRSRPKAGEEVAPPKWMNGIASFTPGRSLVVGAGIGAANPKNVVVGLAAAVAISSAGLSTGHQIVAVAVYVVIAILGVAAPLVVMLCLRGRSQAILDGWKSWLGQNNSTVMAVLFVVFGVVLVGRGVGVL